jgi:putative ABC transport system substrate-binding protein
MRRVFLWLLLLAAPFGHLHAAERVFRLGELASSAATLEYLRKVTLPELAKLGFEEGRNLILDERAGGADAVDRVARELVQNKPDAIIVTGSDAIRAASRATSTVPIVVFGVVPRGEGAPASFARPGGNITGVVILGPELDGKRLELLHQAVPDARRIAGLFVPWGMYRDQSEREMRKVADSTGVELLPVDPEGPQSYPSAFKAMSAAGVQALVIMAHADLFRDRDMLTKLALQAGLPTACEWSEMARAGCLLGYGPSLRELFRRLAYYVAHIFNGRAPGELPIEQPTRYEFAINLKTAKALGITIPAALLARADEVIE